MITVYIYLLATLADWEIGSLTAELNSRRFFRPDAPQLIVKTVAVSKNPVKTMGGLTIIPDCTIDEIEMSEKTVLILPGADTWSDAENAQIIQKASVLLSKGGSVEMSLVRSRKVKPLKAVCVERTAVGRTQASTPIAEITGSATGSLMWAKLIIEKLGLFKPETLEAWYAYFSTGKAEHFFALMQNVQQ